MASYNREESTVACIRSLVESSAQAHIDLKIVLVDASSTDRTGVVVKKCFPNVHLISVPDTSFWASSMRKAWEASKTELRDFVLWLNDDVLLDSNALDRLLKTASDLDEEFVVAGSTLAPESNQITYGGYYRGPWFKRLSLKRVSPTSEVRFADLANGNILLIPDKIDRSLGGFPSGFHHAMADLVFTYKASRRKVGVAVAPGTFGTCAENPTRNTWLDASIPVRERLRLLRSPKGLPMGDWARLCFSLGGLSAPLYLIAPLIRAIRL